MLLNSKKSQFFLAAPNSQKSAVWLMQWEYTTKSQRCALLPCLTICRPGGAGCRGGFCPAQGPGSGAHCCAGGGSLRASQRGCSDVPAPWEKAEGHFLESELEVADVQYSRDSSTHQFYFSS